MKDGLTMLAWVHWASDWLIALSCFVIASSLAYLALKHRRAKLALVFHVFGVLFTFGGMYHACEAAGWHAAGALFKALTAISIVACAAVTVRCVPAARAMFARVAAIDRAAGRRLERLRTDPRYDTPEDRQWQGTLAEIKDLARLARETNTAEEV